MTKEEVIEVMAMDGLQLKYLPDELKDDKEVVMTAISENGHALKYASDRLKDDKEIAIPAMMQDGNALQYVSERLKSDKDVVMTAIFNGDDVLQYVPDELKNDKIVAMITAFRDKEKEYSSPEISERDIEISAVNTAQRDVRNRIRQDLDVQANKFARLSQNDNEYGKDEKQVFKRTADWCNGLASEYEEKVAENERNIATDYEQADETGYGELFERKYNENYVNTLNDEICKFEKRAKDTYADYVVERAGMSLSSQYNSIEYFNKIKAVCESIRDDCEIKKDGMLMEEINSSEEEMER